MEGEEGVVGDAADGAGGRRGRTTNLQARRRGRRMRAADAHEAPELGDDDGEWCREHGFVRHVLVHEAGHAVAALANDIVFEGIVIYGDGRSYSSRPAEVKFASKDHSWALPNPAGSLRFALAGECAERAVLGDAYPESGRCDELTWLTAVGLTGQVTDAQVHALLGRSADDVSGETSDLVEANVERIDRLAGRLAELRQELPADQDCDFSYNEVVAFLT